MAYEKTHDLISLATLMQSNREGLTLTDIANEFKVSRRTAERMRDMILAQFPQIEELADGAYKRWRIPQGTLKDFIQFSAEELAAIEVANKLLEKHNFCEHANLLKNVYNKIRAGMKTELYNRVAPDVEVLTEAGGFALRAGPKLNVNTDILCVLKEAILACKKIEIIYPISKNEDIIMVVHPYGFVYGNFHYLIAFSEYVQNFRYYILHKIKSAKILDSYFSRDDKFSIQEYVSNSFGIYQEEPFEVEWLFSSKVAEDAAQYIFHPSQSMTKNEDGSLTVKFKAGGSKEMDWHLYTWGDNVKVIKPTDWEKRKADTW